MRVDYAKPPNERGKYLDPALYGRPPSAAIHDIRQPAPPVLPGGRSKPIKPKPR